MTTSVIGIIFVVITLAASQTWKVQNYFSGTTCSGNAVAVQYTLGGSCTPISCTVSGSQSFSQTCGSASVPALPATWLGVSSFTGAGCSGSALNNVVGSAV